MSITAIRARIHSAHLAISNAEMQIEASRASDSAMAEALAQLAAAQAELSSACAARVAFFQSKPA